MLAAVGASDQEIMDMLTEAGRTRWGGHQVLDGSMQPELKLFLQRVKAEGSAFRPRWDALPPVMRSAGDNPESEWTRYLCSDGRAYYRKQEQQTQTTARVLLKVVCQSNGGPDRFVPCRPSRRSASECRNRHARNICQQRAMGGAVC